jgi:hypothetical protein
VGGNNNRHNRGMDIHLAAWIDMHDISLHIGCGIETEEVGG